MAKLQAEVVRAGKMPWGAERWKGGYDLASGLRKTNREQKSQWLGKVPSWKFLNTPALRPPRQGRCCEASEALGWGSGFEVGGEEHTGPNY